MKDKEPSSIGVVCAAQLNPLGRPNTKPPPMEFKERLDYAKLCVDRFVEVYKARLTVWTFVLLAVVTLTGFGIQYNQKLLFLLASSAPLALWLIDTVIKRYYASPFLYMALKMEAQVLGCDSATLLFVGANLPKRILYQKILAIENDDEREREFRSAYVRSGALSKLSLLLLVSMAELLLWWAWR